MKNVIVFCAGVGRTGKSAVSGPLAEKGFIPFPSPTRAYYKAAGVKSEQELLLGSAAFRREFQEGMVEFYVKATQDFIETHRLKSDAPLFCERSPLDALAYLTFHAPNIDLTGLEHYQKLVIDQFNQFVNDGHSLVCALFPYPTSWIRAGAGEDGFRSTLAGKDTTVQALITHYAIMCADKVTDFGNVYMREAPVEERVAILAEVVNAISLDRTARLTPNRG